MLVLVQGGLTTVRAEGANTKGYSSTYLAMGIAHVRAGTRVLMLVLVQASAGSAYKSLGLGYILSLTRWRKYHRNAARPVRPQLRTRIATCVILIELRQALICYQDYSMC